MLFLVNGQGVPSVAKFIRIDTGLPVPPAVPSCRARAAGELGSGPPRSAS